MLGCINRNRTQEEITRYRILKSSHDQNLSRTGKNVLTRTQSLWDQNSQNKMSPFLKVKWQVIGSKKGGRCTALGDLYQCKKIYIYINEA